MSIFTFFSTIKKSVIKNDEQKIYEDYDQGTKYRLIKMDENTQVDEIIDQMLKQLIQQDKMEEYQNDTNPSNYCLILIIEDLKTKQIIAKKELYDFEHPQNYIKNNKDNNNSYNLVFKKKNTIQKENNDILQQLQQNQTTKKNNFVQKKKISDEYERQGYLQKLNNDGQYKEKYFVLKKDQLLYSKSLKEIEKNFNWIPLQYAKAEQINEFKLIFELRLSENKSYILKAKKQVDMTAWILAINKQAFIATENHILKEDCLQIKQIQKQFNNSIFYEIKNIFNSFNFTRTNKLNTYFSFQTIYISLFNKIKISFYKYLSKQNLTNVLFYSLILEFNTLFQRFRTLEQNIQAFITQQIIMKILKLQIQLIDQQNDQQVENKQIDQDKELIHILQLIHKFSDYKNWYNENQEQKQSYKDYEEYQTQPIINQIDEIFLKFQFTYCLDIKFDVNLIEKIRDINDKNTQNNTKITNQNYIKDSFKNLAKILLENINNEYRQFTKTKEFIDVLNQIEFNKLQYKFSNLYDKQELTFLNEYELEESVNMDVIKNLFKYISEIQQS